MPLPAEAVGNAFARVAGRTGFVDAAIDGAGTAAFLAPGGMASDPAGNLFVADAVGMRRITPAGVVTTLAGARDRRDFGFTDGTAEVARFTEAVDAARVADGSLYVADKANFAIRQVLPDGSVRTIAGGPKQRGTADGVGTQAQFRGPWRIVPGPDGALYVLDVTTERCRDDFSDQGLGPIRLFSEIAVRRVTLDGTVTTVPGAVFPVERSSTFAASLPEFYWLAPALAVDRAGVLHVSLAKTLPGGFVVGVGCGTPFSGATAAWIQRVHPDGSRSVLSGSTTEAGAVDGAAGIARFRAVQSMAFDAGGTLWAVDFLNHAIRRIQPDGTVTTPIGQLGVTSTAIPDTLPGTLQAPATLAFAPDGTLRFFMQRGLLMRTERR